MWSVLSRKLKLKPTKNKSVLIGLSLIVLFFAYDLSGVGGNYNFYTSWGRCGQVPVLPGSTVAGGPKYYEAAAIFNPMRLYAGQYFCSPRDAELAGYSASSRSYEYPHLSDTERECLALMRNDLPYDPEACKDIQ